MRCARSQALEQSSRTRGLPCCRRLWAHTPLRWQHLLSLRARWFGQRSAACSPARCLASVGRHPQTRLLHPPVRQSRLCCLALQRRPRQ